MCEGAKLRIGEFSAQHAGICLLQDLVFPLTSDSPEQEEKLVDYKAYLKIMPTVKNLQEVGLGGTGHCSPTCSDIAQTSVTSLRFAQQSPVGRFH